MVLFKLVLKFKYVLIEGGVMYMIAMGLAADVLYVRSCT